ncbi:MAG TPA: hypothetical protein VFE63_06185 [Roseiarcus sp.]|nr:hypothetical protein [Roseiarcus sp.]
MGDPLFRQPAEGLIFGQPNKVANLWPLPAKKGSKESIPTV